MGVLRGGPSAEYEVSLKTGAEVLKHLPENKYEARDIFIDKNGVWHLQGKPSTPNKLLRQVDVVFNALHGTYGEDGEVQRLMDMQGIRYTGSGALQSAVAMNKIRTKEVAQSVGLKVARHEAMSVSHTHQSDLMKLFREYSPPLVVKPVVSGSSVGVTLAKTFAEFSDAVTKAFEVCPKVMVEEYISGKEATIGVLEHFRGQTLYAMLPIEIIPPQGKFFDYEAKYTGISQELCPGNFTLEEKTALEKYAKTIHEALELRHYSRSDFIIHPKRGIFFLETNTLPGLTSESLVPKSLKAAGCDFPIFLDHLVELAMRR